MISGPPFKYPYFIRVKNEEAIVMSIDTVTFCFGLFDCRWRPVKYVNGIDKKQKDLFDVLSKSSPPGVVYEPRPRT